MAKLLNGLRLEIDHYNLIAKLPIHLPNYEESVKQLTKNIVENPESK